MDSLLQKQATASISTILQTLLGELDRDKSIVIFSSYSLRAYEAAFILKKQGFGNVRVLDGRLEMWPYEKLQ